MPTYRLTVTGEVRETYTVVADSPEAARKMFDEGEITETDFSEVTSAEVTGVEEIDE